jgi:hypothetical protein
MYRRVQLFFGTERTERCKLGYEVIVHDAFPSSSAVTAKRPAASATRQLGDLASVSEQLLQLPHSVS